MLTLSAKIRKDFGKKVKALRKKGIIPGVLYGPETKALCLEVDLKEFEKVFRQAGETSLISLDLDGEKEKFLVLIHAVEIDAISQKPIHVDFYQPRPGEEIEASIHLIFEGEAMACKELGGTLIKNIYEVEVKALPQNLPKEIKVNIEKLKTFEDNILVKDLIVSKDVKILKDPEEMVALVAPPEKMEEELQKPIAAPEGEPRLVGREEKVEEIKNHDS